MKLRICSLLLVLGLFSGMEAVACNTPENPFSVSITPANGTESFTFTGRYLWDFLPQWYALAVEDRESVAKFLFSYSMLHCNQRCPTPAFSACIPAQSVYLFSEEFLEPISKTKDASAALSILRKPCKRALRSFNREEQARNIFNYGTVEAGMPFRFQEKLYTFADFIGTFGPQADNEADVHFFATCKQTLDQAAQLAVDEEALQAARDEALKQQIKTTVFPVSAKRPYARQSTENQ